MDTVFAEAVNAIQEIVEARQALKPLPNRLKRHLDTSADIIEAQIRDKNVSLTEKIDLGFLHAKKLADTAVEDDDPDTLREAAKALFFAFFSLSRFSHRGKKAQLAATIMAKHLGEHVAKPRFIRRELREREAAFPDIEADFQAILSNNIDRTRSVELARRIGRELVRQPRISVPGSYAPASEPSAAELLVTAADREVARAQLEAEPEAAAPTRDCDLKIKSVTLQGFRGAPTTLVVQFCSSNSPRSGIIFGENGVGKSTIVDAVEFALQGRVGRSSNFDSTISPSIKSFASNASKCGARVTLSDGSKIERNVVITHDGRLVAEPRDVRSEFRLAPVTIKRSDILRFLDTEALERGSILLDYFPADASQIAMRPEEEIHKLKGEMAELRIKRSAYAADLSELLGINKSQLSNAGLLETVVREKIMGGLKKSAFEKARGWDRVDQEVKDALGRLTRVQKRLREVVNRMQKASEILNPMPYRDQATTLAKIVNEIGVQLSEAFQSVAHEHPVARIDVVFAESGPLSLDLVVRLSDGSACFPQQLFSEAYRDLLALLFFVAVARKASERGQAKVMILDDVLQSVDSKVRHSFVTYLLTELPDWQIIFTVHDRLWRDQLRDLFDSFEHAYVNLSIEQWNYLDGPRLSKLSVDSLDRDLRAAVNIAEPRTVAVLAGQLLESICNQLSWRLSLKITRREGDRYTLGDLWPPVQQRLAGTTADQAIRRVASFSKLRNLTSHATTESLSLSSSDASGYAHAVLALLESVRCTNCRSWLRSKSGQCTCGTLYL